MSNRKNIQIIDGADNCTYDIFSVPTEDFELIFPDGRDIEFVDDFFDRVGEAEGVRITEGMWKSREDKKTVHGIHGTLFYQLDFKREFYPTKREGEMVTGLPKKDKEL